MWQVSPKDQWGIAVKRCWNDIETTLKKMVLMLNRCWGGVEEVFKSCWSAVEALLKRCWSAVEALLKRCWSAVGALLKRCWSGVEAMLKRRWSDVEAMLKGCWAPAEKVLEKVLERCWRRYWKKLICLDEFWKMLNRLVLVSKCFETAAKLFLQLFFQSLPEYLAEMFETWQNFADFRSWLLIFQKVFS